MPDSYQNPFKGQHIYFAGRFNFPSEYRIYKLLEQMGGHVQQHLNTVTTLVVFGKNPGAAKQQAQQRSLVLLSEDELLAALAQYNDHLANSERVDQFDPQVSAIVGQFYRHTHLLGLPLVTHVYDEVLGDQQAYSITNSESEFWAKPGLTSLQALMIKSNTRGGRVSPAVDNIHALPELRALALNGHGATVDLSKVLDDAPLLQVLHVEAGLQGQFAVTRHANLEQLMLQDSFIPELSSCSFPKLTYLVVQANDPNGLNRLLVSGALPRLRHIGLVLDEGNVDQFMALEFPATIKGMSITFVGYPQPATVTRILDQLAELPVAKQLNRLVVTAYAFVTSTRLTRQHFPVLRQLKCLFFSVYEEHAPLGEQLGHLQFDDQLHLDMSNCNLNSQQAVHIVRWLSQHGPLASLGLSYNRINAKQARARISKLPFAVNLDEQEV